MTIPDSYYIDLREFSLEKLKELFKTTRMRPSQKILQEDIDRRFAKLEEQRIENLALLQKALKSKRDIHSFSDST